jgi:hypothetical protein
MPSSIAAAQSAYKKSKNMPFTFTFLGYTATRGSTGTGFTAFGPTSNIVVRQTGWTPAAGRVDRWFTTPNLDYDFYFTVARVKTDESQPFAPFTWVYTNNPATGGGGTTQFGGKFGIPNTGENFITKNKGNTLYFSPSTPPIIGPSHSSPGGVNTAVSTLGPNWGFSALMGSITNYNTANCQFVIMPVGSTHGASGGQSATVRLTNMTVVSTAGVDRDSLAFGIDIAQTTGRVDLVPGRIYSLVAKSTVTPQSSRTLGEIAFWQYGTGVTAGGAFPRANYSAGNEVQVANWLNGIPEQNGGGGYPGNWDTPLGVSHPGLRAGTTAYWWSFTGVTGRGSFNWH